MSRKLPGKEGGVRSMQGDSAKTKGQRRVWGLRHLEGAHLDPRYMGGGKFPVVLERRCLEWASGLL